MKELELPKQDKLSVNTEQEKRKEIVHVGRIKRGDGHKIWQLNLKTQELTEAEFNEEVVDFTTGAVKRKIIIKEDHWYESALNRQNAFRKFNNRAKKIVQNLK